MSDDNEDLKRKFDIASAELKKCAGGKQGDSAEKKYGSAYLSLVKAGLAPPLRKRYRGGLK